MSVCAPEALEQSVRHVLVSVDAQGQPSCVPELLDVSGSDVLITFHLNAADWVFPDTGAVLVQNGGTQFPIPSWTVHKKQAALLDCDSAAGEFSYTVVVQHAQTGRRARVDPTIRNDP
ncbi:MAG: hypothetical protein IV093_21865 [Rubrivivax sp.]|nr:hypothetical protein [Rubrivivax sp.]